MIKRTLFFLFVAMAITITVFVSVYGATSTLAVASLLAFGVIGLILIFRGLIHVYRATDTVEASYSLSLLPAVLIFITWFLWMLSTELLTKNGALDDHWPDEVGWAWSLLLVSTALIASMWRIRTLFHGGMVLTLLAFFFPSLATHLVSPVYITLARVLLFFIGFVILDRFEDTQVDAGRVIDVVEGDRTRLFVAYHDLAAQYVTQLGWLLIIPAWPIFFVLPLILATNRYSPYRGSRAKRVETIHADLLDVAFGNTTSPVEEPEGFVIAPPEELDLESVTFAGRRR